MKAMRRPVCGLGRRLEEDIPCRQRSNRAGRGLCQTAGNQSYVGRTSVSTLDRIMNRVVGVLLMTALVALIAFQTMHRN
jgi:hypothetical protein